MNETLLLIGHGARDPEGEGNREVESFAQQLRARHPDQRIDVCFIEYANVLLEEGLNRAAIGAERVIALPLILGAAGHVRMEIPAALEEARQRHPGVEFLCAHHIGAEQPVVEMMRLRLHQAMSKLDMPDPRTTGVVVLARGSSEPAANAEVAKLARWLYETTDHERIEYAFTGITFPRLESAVQHLVRAGMTQLIILPYYLFTGRLMKRIFQQVARLRMTYPDRPMALAPYIGFHEKLFQVVEARAEACRTGEAGRLLCDGCSYRAHAEEEHHHGHGCHSEHL